MQSADHGQRQRTFAVQDFVDAVALPNDRFKILDGQAALIHPEFIGQKIGHEVYFINRALFEHLTR